MLSSCVDNTVFWYTRTLHRFLVLENKNGGKNTSCYLVTWCSMIKSNSSCCLSYNSFFARKMLLWKFSLFAAFFTCHGYIYFFSYSVAVRCHGGINSWIALKIESEVEKGLLYVYWPWSFVGWMGEQRLKHNSKFVLFNSSRLCDNLINGGGGGG